MRKIILYIWQLPQNILGLILTFILPSDVIIDYGKEHPFVIYGSRKMHNGISLGRYAIMRCSTSYTISKVEMAHEYGHSFQSIKWGWLYLFVIGIPSIVRNGLHLYKTGEYFLGFPEKEADKLGGVKYTKNGRRYV